MAPTHLKPVGSPHGTLKPPARADAWSVYYPDQTSTSTLPMHGPPRADGQPLRHDGLTRAPPTQGTRQNTTQPTHDPTSRAPPSPSRARRTVQQRIDDFAVSLPLSAGDKALEYGINVTRKLGRAASRRLNQLQQDHDEPRTPTISQPTLAEWDNLDNQQLVDRESVLADQLARSQAWQQKYARTAPRIPATDNSPRRVIASTWGAVLEAAYKPPTPPEVPEMDTKPFEQPRYDDAADMTRTQRRPIRKPLNTDKPLPPIPRPDSMRRKTVVIRPETARWADSDGSLPPLVNDITLGAQRLPLPTSSDLNQPTSPPFDLLITPTTPTSDALTQFPSHPMTLDGRFRADLDSEGERRVPIVDQFIRAGHISTYVHEIRGGERVDSWHVQHSMADSCGNTAVGSEAEEYEDGATSLWKRLEANAGVRMRD